MGLTNSQTRPTGEIVVPLTVKGAYLTDRGGMRQQNEDSVAFHAPSDPAVLREKGVFGLVADGMGGHEGGEIASALAARLVKEIYYRSSAEPQAALESAFAAANREIFVKSQANRQLLGMGTTCTAVSIVNGYAYCVHAGDSRAYLIRGGQPYCLTEDHSSTMTMVRQGLITLAEARVHEERNVILRAMGTRSDVEPQAWPAPYPLRHGDKLVLCSDGLYETIEEAEIVALTAEAPPEAACRKLIDLAIERRSSDNVSAVLLYMTGIVE